ncbi:ANTAR domain-containing protein [Halomonas sp. McH1-25]|uniref:ANTAR domain-containing response regulator n=1 Tax=unclassified Halomonas TaxID=2609666 RepID=UPI001EF4320C|nr:MULTISPECIES: ANTAR domain-containing protein [unclassified Halomonas]MCG7600090.1 ANTAR domain-containing protein [Halomonas sp. McH1-25]MCP1341339.1 ANTAR domain-containing protein [Halomonas sp. FL8]MCP1359716.1 ANTAR domain-containing protein [Halomonas sp. BBD45]MCP1364835.1 ANTAR domain-containing protein [Halomonas sp. BBD48]
MAIRVLIVDTKDERSQALERALAEAGFEVVSTVDEQDDLYSTMEALQPDAVIVDAALPSRDTLEHLGQLGRRYPKPMIMLAEEETPDLTQQATRAGVSAYVIDSISPALVRSMLNVSISSFESFRALKGELSRTQETLAQRRAIDRAKAMIMELRGLGEDAAYQYMRKTAMNRRMTIHELAQELLSATGNKGK